MPSIRFQYHQSIVWYDDIHRPFEYYYLRFIKIIYQEKVDVGGRGREHPFPPFLQKAGMVTLRKTAIRKLSAHSDRTLWAYRFVKNSMGILVMV